MGPLLPSVRAANERGNGVLRFPRHAGIIFLKTGCSRRAEK